MSSGPPGGLTRYGNRDVPPQFAPVRLGAFLADQLAALLTARPDAAVVVCDVSAVDQPRAADLDHLARSRLTTRRAGRDFVLQGVGTRLRLLLALTGFGEVLDGEPGGPSAPDGDDGGRPAGKPS